MKIPTSIRLNENEIKLLSDLSKSLGLSRTETIHRAVKLFLTIKTVNLVSLLSPIVGYLESLNHLISSHKKQIEGLPENHLIFNAISEWMNIYDKHHSLLTSILKDIPYQYEKIIDADRQMALRRLALNNIFFTEELGESYHALVIESLKSLVKQDDIDAITFYNYHRRLSRCIDLLEALEEDVDQLLHIVLNSIMRAEEMGFSEASDYLNSLNTELDEYINLVEDLIKQAKHLLIQASINYLNRRYKFSREVIRELAEKPLKPDEIMGIAGKYGYSERELYHFLKDLLLFRIAVYEEDVYKISFQPH